VVGRDAVRDAGVGDLSFGAGDALGDGGLGDEEGRRDLGGGEAADGAEREGDLGLFGERGVAAGEDEFQAVAGFAGQRPLELGEFVAVDGLAAEDVQAAAAGDGEQPGVGVVGDAFGGPAVERCFDGVLHDVLGGGEVAEEPDEAGGEPARVFADDAGQLVVHLVHQVRGRISMSGQAGQVLAMARASSRSATSISA
jgi:hypothetical protein